MNINSQAPAIARHDILIAAPSERVWELLADIDHWPTWHPAIATATLEGALVPGTRFRWRSGGTAITSTLQEVEPQRRLSWTGSVMGIQAIHTWSIEPREQAVVVSTAESFEGWLARLLRPTLQTMLDNSLQAWLQQLKQTAEATPPAATSSPV